MKSAVSGCLAAVLLSLCFASTQSHAQTSGYSTTNAFGTLNFADPVVIASPPGETDRIFVVEQVGRIIVVTNLAFPDRTVFLDITGRIGAGGEQGLLGLAFHPGYATNGYFFVFYTSSGTRMDRLSRFETSPTNPNQGLPASEVILINQFDEASNHNGGDLHFGTDGYLYVSLGDEGGANDQYQNSQRIDKDFFAGLLRIDVDMKPGSLAPNSHPASVGNYTIPPDNPFVGATSFNGLPVNPASVRTEFWAVGLRNPWRFSFDSANGLLYLADVGQGAREEVDIIVRGGNYGWNYREGFIARPGSGAPPAGFVGIDPILDYGRGTGPDQGNSVTGGRVYRGNRIPPLIGKYVFADYVSGNIWTTFYNGATATTPERILGENDIAAFGVDPSNGDILMGDLDDDMVRRLVYTEPSALLVSLVPYGADWKYLDNGSDQGTAWQAPEFNDASWVSGPGELGYGDGDEATVVNGGPVTSRFITTYFRHAWDVPEPSLYTSLNVSAIRDDGILVYLNGTEILRDNLPDGGVTAATTAPLGIAGGDETTPVGAAVDPSLLRAGRNVLAAEVHQSSGTSSDMSFNLELAGEILPELQIVRNDAGAILSWPAPSPGYLLQSTLIFDPTAWRVSNLTVDRDGSRHTAHVGFEDFSLFFRLARIQSLVTLERPESQSVISGQGFTLSVVATGNDPLAYQWFLNNNLIAGATGADYTVASAQLSDAGDYRVDIEDNTGQTASWTASIEVFERPAIVQQPQSVTATVGEDVSFTVTVSGSVPMWYRWRRASVTLTNEQSNELTSTYTIRNVQLSHAGNYSVIVTNLVSIQPGLLSSLATLTVNE